MYDYLAKIILLGPSGCGKCVAFRRGHPRPGAHLAPDRASSIG